jgi:hypothetical protein
MSNPKAGVESHSQTPSNLKGLKQTSRMQKQAKGPLSAAPNRIQVPEISSQGNSGSRRAAPSRCLRPLLEPSSVPAVNPKLTIVIQSQALFAFTAQCNSQKKFEQMLQARAHKKLAELMEKKAEVGKASKRKLKNPKVKVTRNNPAIEQLELEAAGCKEILAVEDSDKMECQLVVVINEGVGVAIDDDGLEALCDGIEEEAAVL